LALMQVFHELCACVKHGGGFVACDQRKGSENPWPVGRRYCYIKTGCTRHRS